MNVEIEIATSEVHKRFIEVIKFVRGITGWGLKESKEFVVDGLRAKNPIDGPSKFVFAIESICDGDTVENELKTRSIDARVVPFSTSVFKELKGCFSMVSATKVHLYLENGEENKLSMVIDVGKMQDMIRMFTENCRNGG